MTASTEVKKVSGYLPEDTPPIGAMLSLGFQQVLTMFPATVLCAILTKFDVGVTLLGSGIGTIIALLVSKRKIPMYYGSSFSYIAVFVTVMSLYAKDCFASKAAYCPEGVRIAQVGILGTGVFEILIGLLIMKIGKAALDKVLPPVISGSMAIVIGIGLAGAALGMAGANWTIAIVTLLLTVVFSVYLQNRGLLGMLPILLGAIAGYLISIPFGTAHLYQMSLYIDQLAKDLGRAPLEIKNLIGLNLVADGADDLVMGLIGGTAGTNYGENNSLMAITRNYSVPVLMAAGVMAILLGFVGTLAALVASIPVAVTGGLAIYLFGVIGMQGIALIQSEKVNLFEPRQLAVGATILICGIGGNMTLKDGLFPFLIPYVFPVGVPAIVFAAFAGIVMNLIFLVLPPKMFGVEERENLN
ncbi:MAG: xanthine permease [Chloroflexi bacterium]|nr:xanthine permease [Chloroflexota bacterium]